MSKYRVKNGDCIELMRKYNDESIDLIVTDPPYGINYQSKRRNKENRFAKIENDNGVEFLSEAFKQFYRVLKDGTACYVFCSWHNVDIFKYEFEKYFKLKNILIWNKNVHGTGDLN